MYQPIEILMTVEAARPGAHDRVTLRVTFRNAFNFVDTSGLVFDWCPPLLPERHVIPSGDRDPVPSGDAAVVVLDLPCPPRTPTPA